MRKNRPDGQHIQQLVLFSATFMLMLLSVASWAENRTRVESKQDLLRAWGLETPAEGFRIKGASSKGIERVTDNEIEQVAEDYERVSNLRLAELSIHFAYNSADISPDSYDLLQICAGVLQENPTIKILIAGHTDSIGSHAFNLDLSQRRAESIRHWLLSRHHIEAGRLVVHAYGEEHPIASNNTVAGRASNRRVEFVRYR